MMGNNRHKSEPCSKLLDASTGECAASHIVMPPTPPTVSSADSAHLYDSTVLVFYVALFGTMMGRQELS
jgi:hypothetical protein